MIFKKTIEEHPSQNQYNDRNKFLNRHNNPFRATTFIIRKNNKSQQFQVASPHKNHINPQKNANIASQEYRSLPQVQNQLMENTCSKFMKNYIEKLKKQRKRQNKKLNKINQRKNKDFNSQLNYEITSILPMSLHDNEKVLILDKIHHTHNTPIKTRNINSLPSKRTLDNDQLAQIIKEIKDTKSWMKNQRQLEDLCKRHNQGQIFPEIRKKISDKRQKKIRDIYNFRSLDPWENSNDQEFQYQEQY